MSNYDMLLQEASTLSGKYEGIVKRLVESDRTAYRDLRFALEQDLFAGQGALDDALYKNRQIEKLTMGDLQIIDKIVRFSYSNVAANELLNAATIKETNESENPFQIATVYQAIIFANSTMKKYGNPEIGFDKMLKIVSELGSKNGIAENIINSAKELAFEAYQRS